MAIQYLLVAYPEQRAVLADGAGVGFTNHMMMLPSDEYQITLEGEGYQPQSQNIVLSGTSMVKPMVISFEPSAASAGVAAAVTDNVSTRAETAVTSTKGAVGARKKNA